MESFGKFISTKTAHAATVGGHPQYVQLMEATLRSAAFLQPWAEASLSPESGHSSEVTHVLGIITDFFHNVICAVAVSDLHHLVQYHLQHEKARFEKHC